MSTTPIEVQARATIGAAFAGLPVPDPKMLIRHLHSRDRGGEERIRKDLAHRNWQSLPAGFLESRWFSFCYLSPEGYRYYLPAALTAALDADRTLAHSVVFGLRPSFWSLYYEGEDRDFRAKQSAFTPDQYRAVGTFLGFAFEQKPDLRHLAAQALRWGWAALDTPALEAAQRYYHELHTYSHPEPGEPAVGALVAEIRAAFAETPYPGDHELCGSDQGDEPAEYAMELRGLQWRSLHPELLARNYAALSFLSDAGFRYFLPAFLIADLSGDESNADPVFHLTRGVSGPEGRLFDASTLQLVRSTLGPAAVGMFKRAARKFHQIDWRQYSLRRFAAFTQPERLAIIRYLEHQATDEFNAAPVHRALEGYWRPSVAQPSV